jgi:drug/metabolite transporter (DMT)-like permease
MGPRAERPAARGPSRGVALGMIVSAGACWGLAAVIAKTAFDRGVAPVRMAEARVAVALVVLGAYLAWRRRDLLRPPRGSLPVLGAFGVFVAGVNASYYVAIDRLPVGVALSLQYTAPTLLLAATAVVSRRRRRTARPGGAVWIAAASTLTGAVLVSRAYAGLHGVSAAGVAAGAASALFFALYLLGADQAGRRGVPPATLLTWGFVFATLVWSVLSPWWSWPWGKLGDVHVSLAVLGVGLLGTLLPFFLAVTAIPVLTPALAGIGATVEPPFAAAFAWIFLGQYLGVVQIAGGVLVLLGVVLAQRASTLSREALLVEQSP